MNKIKQPAKKKLHVGLFVTCLVDLFRPQIGFAAVKLLENAGCRVSVPLQTCCGQPAYNNGDNKDAKKLAVQTLEAFEQFDYVVIPSGSCGGMISKHYPELFANDTVMLERTQHLSNKTYELISFLLDVIGITQVDARYDHTVTYHDACSGLRELGIKQQPRKLLASVKGINLKELPDSEVCCGFGGTFCIKYPEISDKIVTEKINHIQSTAADTLLAGDLGCLLNMAGKLQRCNHSIKVLHVAEVLADMADGPGIGEA
jgi:L-lactate dehydrogenase complex protein LldE